MAFQNRTECAKEERQRVCRDCELHRVTLCILAVLRAFGVEEHKEHIVYCVCSLVH